MSKLPLMHSISTVGVIKHYNQDYLIHDTRTDFTGPNGIGKSLLADLLQILFIAERKKIHFGTDSVKKEHRQIHTIPHKTANAYFFLNIEVEHKMYITFGVNIPNTSSSQLKLFRILNDHFDTDKDLRRTKRDRLSLGQNLIPEHKLPYFNDFIVNGTIPSIDILTKHLRDEKELFLDAFTKKNERNELYQFLFDKQILPLNLSQEAHLNAFAKVLQAFSKANTLDTDKDESLKSFLFENKKKDIENEYKQNKQNLDDYVDRYKNLSELIDTLSTKREYLQVLEKLLEKHKSSEKEYLRSNFYKKKVAFEKKVASWNEIKVKFEVLKTGIEKLEKSIPDLENKEKDATVKFKSYSTGFNQLNNCQTKNTEYLKNNEALEALNNIELPQVAGKTTNAFDFETITLNTVLDNINILSKTLKTYDTIQGVEKQFQDQKKNLEAFKSSLLLRKSNLVKLSEILDFNNDKSFAAQLLKNKSSLTLGQETIVRALLLETNWETPEEIIDGVTYTSTIDIIDNKYIQEDKKNKGFWYSLGDLKKFVSYISSERLFDDKNALTQAINNKKKKLLTDVNILDKKLNDFNKLEKGNVEVLEVLDLDFVWDVNIPDQRKVTDFKSYISMVQNIDVFRGRLQKSINTSKSELDELVKTIPFKFSVKNIKDEITRCSKEQTRFNELQLSASRALQENRTLLSTKNEVLEKIVYDPEEIEKNKNEEQKKLDYEQKKLIIKHPDLKDGLNVPVNDNLDELRDAYALDKKDYELQYKQALISYKELKDDIEVKDEITKETFVFQILEKKLLGNDIRATQNIEKALNSIYINRNKLASTIIDTMLKIFHKTQNEYDGYKSVVARLNTFFKGELISKKYYFQVNFEPNTNFKISWINSLSSRAQSAGLFDSETVEGFVEDAFKNISGYSKHIEFSDLLDPKTYFTLKTEFKDSDGLEYPGSTGESYTARVLLGIGRLSIVSKEDRNGLRFLILEEVSNLDDENFNTFPEIAKKYDYQIITMTPEPIGSNNERGWYLHQLIEGKSNKNINYSIPNSSFKTNYQNEQLKGYLKRKESK